ncbi:hypothetical protein Tco_0678486 [Tanacetum coccineum]|uniref:Retrovirus-related Pol polyprotein from transposon TNT 1-94 n=1 Tax=Tanacetum coccineum TaxID=301880 RepID=A0ABQ4XFR9_9ASTR
MRLSQTKRTLNRATPQRGNMPLLCGGGDGGGVGDDGGDGLRLWLPDGEGRRRVEESEVSGWLDRLTRSILDVAGKIPPEKFSGGGAVAAAVAGGGGRPPVATGCCANILWMKSQLTDYDIIYEKVSIFCDNTSAIAISNNPVLHTRTKHIDIRYHFIKDHILKGDTELHFIPTQYQLANIFTKPLDEPTFKRLIVELSMLNIDSKTEPSVIAEEN